MKTTKINLKELEKDTELLQKVISLVFYGVSNIDNLSYEKIQILSIVNYKLTFLSIRMHNFILTISVDGFFSLFNLNNSRYIQVKNSNEILKFILDNQYKENNIINNKTPKYSLQKFGKTTWKCIKCDSIPFNPYVEKIEFKYCPYCGSLIEGIETEKEQYYRENQKQEEL